MSSYGDEALLNRAGLPEPRPTELSRPHWQGCQNGELLVQQCDSCQHYSFPPEAVCPRCFQNTLNWQKSSGLGKVYSFTVIHRPQRPEFQTPYVAAIIELEEGWFMLSNIVDCDPDDVYIGQAVKVHFGQRGNSSLPFFTPATSS